MEPGEAKDCRKLCLLEEEHLAEPRKLCARFFQEKNCPLVWMVMCLLGGALACWLDGLPPWA